LHFLHALELLPDHVALVMESAGAMWIEREQSRANGRENGGEWCLPMHGKFSLWRTVSIPSSTKNILRKKARDDFSPIQKLGAAIRLYTALRPQERFQLALEYTARWKSHKGSRSLATNSPTTP
jgi:hypothetical protein